MSLSASKITTGDEHFESLTQRALELGATAARVIRTDQVVFDPRSHFKCRFGCSRWGRYWTCPPHTILNQDQFDKAFAHYGRAMVVQTKDAKDSQDVTVTLEKEAMLQHGCPFAMALALCDLCSECAYPEPCRFPHLARPSMDCYGIDIAATVEPLGLQVDFDPQGEAMPAFYSMVLLD